MQWDIGFDFKLAFAEDCCLLSEQNDNSVSVSCGQLSCSKVKHYWSELAPVVSRVQIIVM